MNFIMTLETRPYDMAFFNKTKTSNILNFDSVLCFCMRKLCFLNYAPTFLIFPQWMSIAKGCLSFLINPVTVIFKGLELHTHNKEATQQTFSACYTHFRLTHNCRHSTHSSVLLIFVIIYLQISSYHCFSVKDWIPWDHLP